MDYYHIEGFQDWCMYARNKYGLKIDTWVETPCMTALVVVGKAPLIAIFLNLFCRERSSHEKL